MDADEKRVSGIISRTVKSDPAAEASFNEVRCGYLRYSELELVKEIEVDHKKLGEKIIKLKESLRRRS